MFIKSNLAMQDKTNLQNSLIRFLIKINIRISIQTWHLIGLPIKTFRLIISIMLCDQWKSEEFNALGNQK